jgi:hypothetical protein
MVMSQFVAECGNSAQPYGRFAVVMSESRLRVNGKYHN